MLSEDRARRATQQMEMEGSRLRPTESKEMMVSLVWRRHFTKCLEKAGRIVEQEKAIRVVGQADITRLRSCRCGPAAVVPMPICTSLPHEEAARWPSLSLMPICTSSSREEASRWPSMPICSSSPHEEAAR